MHPKLSSLTSIEKLDYFNFGIILGDFCNYRCSYCARSNKDFDNRKETINSIKEALPYIKTLISNALHSGQKIRLQLIGGETLFYPIAEAFRLLLTNLPQVVKIKVTTNLSLDFPSIARLQNQLSSYPQLDPIQYVCSFHEEFVKWDDFLNKVIKLSQLDRTDAKIQFTLTTRNQGLLDQLISDCKVHNIPLKITHGKDFSSEKQFFYFPISEESLKKMNDNNTGDLSTIRVFYNSHKDFFTVSHIDELYHLYPELSIRGSHCNLYRSTLLLSLPEKKFHFGSKYCKHRIWLGYGDITPKILHYLKRDIICNNDICSYDTPGRIQFKL